MTRRTSWRGDWQARICARVRSRGFDTATAFAEARPRATLFALVEELGSEDVNVAQVVTLLRDEAERSDSVARFTRSLLVHELHEFVPRGWRVDTSDGFDFDFKVAAAVASTAAALPQSASDIVGRVGRKMMAAELPVGWLPDGPDDPIVVGFFERAAGDNHS